MGPPARRHATIAHTLIPHCHRAGATILIDGVDTTHQSTCWRDAGADTTTDAAIGPPCTPGEITAYFTPSPS